ncbi:MAG: adenylate cyclase [Desulforhopalus sp.]
MSSILIIDGSSVITKGCEEMLASLGHNVIPRYKSSRGLDISDLPDINLVIINSSQDKDADIERFRSLRERYPSLKGILVAYEGEFDLVVEAMNSGFSRVCIKPLDLGKLKETVDEIFLNEGMREEVTRMKALLPLYRLGQKLLGAETEEQIFDDLAEIIRKEFDAPTVSIMMLDDESGSLKIVAHRGLEQQYVDKLQILPGERIAGKVFETNTPAILNRGSQGQSPYGNLLVRPELSAAISFPITSHDKVVGVINVSETENSCLFTESDLEMLSIISDQAMMALGNIRAMKAREEQGRVRTLLEQYVSPEVSKMLVDTRQDLMDVGSIKDLTVLFADIRNFTLLVQQISPRQLREFLNIFFELFTSIVFSHKGMLDKFMGDAGLVVFGAPVTIKKPTFSAVSVAIELVGKFKEMQRTWSNVHPVFTKISLGVGISRGPLFLGNIGSAKRVDYTVIGTEVNISQRLASETEVGQVLLTEQAYEDVKDAFVFENLGPMLLRGMTSEVGVYRLCNK